MDLGCPGLWLLSIQAHKSGVFRTVDLGYSGSQLWDIKCCGSEVSRARDQDYGSGIQDYGSGASVVIGLGCPGLQTWGIQIHWSEVYRVTGLRSSGLQIWGV